MQGARAPALTVTRTRTLARTRARTLALTLTKAHWDESRAVLLANDQLRRQMSEGGAFAEYREGEILFRPTYKFDSKVPTEG